MSEHRYPCMAEPPVVEVGLPGHIHACIHDAASDPMYRIPEHECECGIKWRPAPVQIHGSFERVRVEGFWSRFWKALGVRT